MFPAQVRAGLSFSSRHAPERGERRQQTLRRETERYEVKKTTEHNEHEAEQP